MNLLMMFVFFFVIVDSHSAVMDKSTVGLTSGSSDVHSSNLPASSGQLKATGSSVASNNIDGAPSSVDLNKNHVAVGSRDVPIEQKSVDSLPLPRPSSSEVRFTSSNSKSEQTTHEQHVGESKFHARSRGVVKTAVNDTYVPRPASSHSNSTGSRPSSNYSNRSHQAVGPQRGNSVIHLFLQYWISAIYDMKHLLYIPGDKMCI